MKNGVIFYSITIIHKMRYFWPKRFFLGHWNKKLRVESNFQLSWPVFHKIYWILCEILMKFDRWILDWWYFSKESKKSFHQFFTHSSAFGGSHPTVQCTEKTKTRRKRQCVFMLRKQILSYQNKTKINCATTMKRSTSMT